MTQPPIVPGDPPPQWPYVQPMAYYGPPVPQIVTKPGGMSGAAHAVHILICFFTCGLWLIPYLLIVGAQPAKRYEVIVPFGADPAAVQAAYAQVSRANVQRTQLTPEQKAARDRTVRITLLAIGGAVLLAAVTAVIGYVLAY